MKTVLLVVLTGAGAFAAGWFLKPFEKAGAAVRVPTAAARKVAGVSRAANPFREALAPAAGSESVAFQPFRSVDEVLALAEGLLGDNALDEIEETAIIEMLEALPRLLVTDISTVRSLLEQIDDVPKSHEVRMMAAAMLAGRWILQEPEAATSYVFENAAMFSEDPSHKPGSSQVVFGEDDFVGSTLVLFGVAITARRNPGAVEAMLDLLPDVYLGDFGDLLTMLEAKADPAKFLTTASEETIEDLDDVTPILARWAKQDPQAALRWTQTLEDPDDDAWTAIARGWAEKDRAAATAWASSLTDEDHRRATLGAIALKAVEGLDAAAADAALGAFPPEVAARVTLEHFASRDQTPAAAAAMVQDIMAQFPDDSEIMEAAAEPAAAVAREFVKEENGETQAIAWLSGLPEGLAKSRAVITLIDQWAEDDPIAASAWVKALPPGSTRESATLQLIDEIRGNDPERAIEWAKSIGTEDIRRERVHSIFQAWLPENPHMAMEALAQFSAEEQDAMFRR